MILRGGHCVHPTWEPGEVTRRESGHCGRVPGGSRATRKMPDPKATCRSYPEETPRGSAIWANGWASQAESMNSDVSQPQHVVCLWMNYTLYCVPLAALVKWCKTKITQ